MRGIQPKQREQPQAKFSACPWLSFPAVFLSPRKVNLYVKQKEGLEGLSNQFFPFCSTGVGQRWVGVEGGVREVGTIGLN